MDEDTSVSASPGSKSERYRRMARRIRAAAPDLKFQAAQDELLGLAAEYERLADYVAGMNRLVELLLSSDAHPEQRGAGQQSAGATTRGEASR
jgi:hypothetical protein